MSGGPQRQKIEGTTASMSDGPGVASERSSSVVNSSAVPGREAGTLGSWSTHETTPA